jgi:hypothetical protein
MEESEFSLSNIRFSRKKILRAGLKFMMAVENYKVQRFGFNRGKDKVIVGGKHLGTIDVKMGQNRPCSQSPRVIGDFSPYHALESCPAVKNIVAEQIDHL